VLGRQIQNGNLITATYLTTSGSAGNGIGYNDDIRYAGNIENALSVSVQTEDDGTVIPSFGGEDEESVDSIKFYAPRTYQAQERAVTADDYLAVLGREYSSRADSYFIWGGEENIPPQYGKVFISIRPKQGRRLSFGEKQAIEKSILGERNLVTITPEVVDPDFLYIIPTITVYYDEAKTVLNSTGIASKVRDFVLIYNGEELGGFQKNFRSSNFTSLIDALAPTINSNTLELKLAKALEPSLGRSSTYTVRFDNALYHPIDGYTPILSSQSFVYQDATSSALVKPNVTAYLEDDGYGIVRIYKIVNNSKVIIKPNIGTIDYETGLVTLKNFAPVTLADGRTEIRITVQPRNRDIFSRRNQIIEIDIDGVSVTAVPEKTKIYNSSTDSTFPR
jgi:hypothetical protein